MKMEGLKIIESFTFVPSCRINTILIFNPTHIFGPDFAAENLENFHVFFVILQIESVQMLKIILQKRIT